MGPKRESLRGIIGEEEEEDYFTNRSHHYQDDDLNYLQ